MQSASSSQTELVSVTAVVGTALPDAVRAPGTFRSGHRRHQPGCGAGSHPCFLHLCAGGIWYRWRRGFGQGASIGGIIGSRSGGAEECESTI